MPGRDPNGLEAQLECPICMDRFVRPKVLPCQHTYCYTCLQQLIARGSSVECPECRRRHIVPSGGFPTSLAIQRMLDLPIDNSMRPNTPARPVVNRSNLAPVRASQVRLTPTAPPVRPAAMPLPPLNPVPRVNPAPRPTSGTSSQCCECNYDCVKSKSKSCLQTVRKSIHDVIRNILVEYKSCMLVTFSVFITITFSRFVAGAAKLSSDCPDERKVAAYLFVKSIFAFMFWIIMLILAVKEKLVRAMNNRCVEVCVAIEAAFTFIWLIVGNAWLFGNWSDMLEECPVHDLGWTQHFINFAFFLTVIDWIVVVAFILYSGYTIWDMENELNEIRQWELRD